MNINRYQPVQVRLVILMLIAVLPLSSALPLRVYAMPEALVSPGTLDPAFDGDGKVITDFDGKSNGARLIAVQPDGRILVAGGNPNAPSGLVRYNSDGSLDSTFSLDENLSIDFISDGPAPDGAGASLLVLQPDGKIVIGGSMNAGADFAVVRYHSDGSPDTTFDGDGKVVTDIDRDDIGISLVLQPDGKIILAGITSPGTVSYNALIRYNSDGSLDTTFGDGGKVITDFGGRGVYSSAILLHPDGKILLGSTTSSYQYEMDFALARFNSDGTLDTSFGDNGKVVKHIFNSNEYCNDITLQPDGNIIAAGHAQVDGGSYGLLARFDTRGALDTTFGTNGKVVSDFGGTNLWGWSVALQPNGRILLGGDSFQGAHALFALERYNKNGTRDLTFGVEGRVATTFGSNGQAGSLVLQRDGKILQAGESYFSATRFDIAMARYLGDETHTVTKTTDTNDGVCNSDCSLREAISVATAGGAINFAPSLSGQTIVLDSTLLIGKDIHIDGSGLVSQVTVSGNDRVPVLEIAYDTIVTINRLIISKGYTEDWHLGGGILNDGTLLITNSTIKDNGGVEGGGIKNLGALEIVNGTVSNNSAEDLGGGILNYGTLTVRNSTFDHNSSTAGGGILNEHGTTKIQDSTFSSNAVTISGGAVHVTSGTLDIENVAFTNNSAESGGALSYNVSGAFDVKDSTFSGNSAMTGGAIMTAAQSTTVTNSTFSNNSASNQGGGIYNGGDKLSIIKSSFYQNSALGWGGGIANQLNGNLTVDNSRLVENSAWNGGGISNAGSLTIQKTEFLNNSARADDPMNDLEGGGGIYNFGGKLTISDSNFIGNTSLEMGGAIANTFLADNKSVVKNSTFSGNSAFTSGGGISSYASYTDGGFQASTFEVINNTFSANTAEQGGGVFNSRAILTVKNSTLSGNKALQGGAIYNDIWGGTLHLSNSILANSINLESEQAVEDCFSGSEGMGINIHNILELNAAGDNACGVPFKSADPALDSLASNGGFTQTMPLLPGSPAINAGDDASCPATDQRGVLRPQGTHCDIGAYETEGTIKVSIGGMAMHSYPLVSGESLRVSFGGVSNGPVKITDVEGASFIAAQRVIYQAADGVDMSFSEMMALPNNQIDRTYWLPWYNNVELDTQLRFANISGATATIHVHIGGQEMTGSPFILLKGESTRKSFPGVNNGPVRIESDADIVAAERVIYKAAGNVGTSFTEMMALPNGQLDTTYYLPWYNNVELDTQLRFANVSDTLATVHVYIGEDEMTGSPFTLQPGVSTRKSFPGVNNGPVKIQSNVPIIAAERVVYKVNSMGTSFTEMMGIPANQLDTTYWLPWYNNTALDTQLRFANVGDTPAVVHVYIGRVEMAGSPFTLEPGASTRQSFANINNGPVQIFSNAPIVAAERVVYKVNNMPASFSEMMALPNSQLGTTYWLPWYNNVDLDTQLRFGLP